MKFYIASSLQNVEQVRALSRLLKDAGWTQTFDWTLYGPEQATDLETLQCIAKREWEGVSAAEVFILLTPQGRGAHTELGMALALCKEVYLCHRDDAYFRCDEKTSAFYWLPQVKRLVGGTEEIARALRNAPRPAAGVRS
jgi:hypothetical protein